MSRARIDSKGINVSLNDSNGGVGVGQDAHNTGFLPYVLPTVTSGEAFTAVPGFFHSVSGSTLCTGTLAAPDGYPGAMVFVTLSNSNGCLLTGAAASSGQTNVFQTMPSNKLGSSPSYGTKLTVANGGSVSLLSDGRFWTPFAASGSITLA
jgi:hypothetical protein